MYKAFEDRRATPRKTSEKRFGGMLNAFKYGAPPHGGSAALGVDCASSSMLLADEPNIREVILFPMTGKAEDLLLMQAPNTVTPEASVSKELHIKVVADKPKVQGGEAKRRRYFDLKLDGAGGGGKIR